MALGIKSPLAKPATALGTTRGLAARLPGEAGGGGQHGDCSGVTGSWLSPASAG